MHERSAIYQCDARAIYFDDRSDRRTVMNNSEELWATSTRSHARPIGLNRLLNETVTRNDYVVVKMDVEGAEYDILECLSRSPSLALVDQLVLERHDRFPVLRAELSKRVHMDRALDAIKGAGVEVVSNWP